MSEQTVVKPAPKEPAPMKPRRNMRMLAIGAILAILCGLAAVWAVNRAGTPRSVVIVTDNVAAGDKVTGADLGTTRVTGGEELATVPANDLRSLIGRRANTALPAGTLATEAAFQRRVTAREGQVIVGVPLEPGQYPMSGLQQGDVVRLVYTDEQQSKTAPSSVSAVVLAVGEPNKNGRRVVDLSVPNGDADRAARAASSGKVSIINVAPGGTGQTSQDWS